MSPNRAKNAAVVVLAVVVAASIATADAADTRTHGFSGSEGGVKPPSLLLSTVVN